MRHHPEKLRRRSIRLQGYDYTQAGAYFFTFCTKDRACLFGEVAEGVMRLNQMGHIVRERWLVIPDHFPHILLDEFVVMPNHVHGIIVVIAPPNGGATHAKALLPNDDAPTCSCGPQRQSVASIVGSFKSAATTRMSEHRRTPGTRVWQRNYFDHIIRNDESLNPTRVSMPNIPYSGAREFNGCDP